MSPSAASDEAVVPPISSLTELPPPQCHFVGLRPTLRPFLGEGGGIAMRMLLSKSGNGDNGGIKGFGGRGAMVVHLGVLSFLGQAFSGSETCPHVLQFTVVRACVMCGQAADTG